MRIIAAMNIVERELQKYLRTSEGMHDAIAATAGALPLYRGWFGTVYLTTAGEFLFRDEEVDPPQVRAEPDEHLQMVALVEGASRFPILANLFPERPLENERCDQCAGTGRFYPRNATGWLYCPECHGLGWEGRLTVPLEPPDAGDERYVSFPNAVAYLENFAREQGITGNVLLLPRGDITVFGRKLFVAQGGRDKRSARTAREYETALRRRLGVSLNVACRVPSGDVAAYVYGPADADEAVRLMYPDGVRYSVPVEVREGVIVGPLRAKVLEVLRRRVTRVREAQEALK